jgi:putative glycosyltransferase (TIGR04348 family)
MWIGIVTPAPPLSKSGNRITALRWARILKNLAHRVSVTQTYDRESYDLLIALHARRSYSSIKNFHREYNRRPIIVALTGTDIYQDLQKNRQAQEAIEIATRIVVLQPKAIEELPEHVRFKARIIYQSAVDRAEIALIHKPVLRPGLSRSHHTFDLSVIGHLRPVKDPFRAALAARLLPISSRIRVLHAGRAMTESMAVRARTEMELNPRYFWLGELSRSRISRLLKQSQLYVLSSRLEGGANSLSEAIVAGIPIVASRIPGTVGILGEDYPGYFAAGKTRELLRLMVRAEEDADFLALLKSHCESLIKLFDPAREHLAWSDLLEELI